MDPVVVALIIGIVGVAMMVLSRTAAKGGTSVKFSIGVNLHDEPDPPPPTLSPDFPLFAADPGYRESVKEEGGFETFDYRCERGEEGTIIDRRTCATTAIGAGCPSLAISRRGPAAHPVAMMPDVSFGSGMFDSLVRVQCADARFAQALIDQRMMEWLLLLSAGTGIQVQGPRALAYGPVTKPWEREPVIGHLRDFLSHVPPSLASLYPATG